jgi:phospholipase A1
MSPMRAVLNARTLAAWALFAAASAQGQYVLQPKAHSLDERWELTDSLRRESFLFSPYKPVFLLPGSWTSRPNNFPSREDGNGPLLNTAIPWQSVEASFQLSLKARAVGGLFGGRGTIWLAYTQRSRWQVYNLIMAQPFRETNYEPEAIFALATDYRILGMRGRLFTIGINHQSNGRSQPLSRNWDRIVAQVGLERGRFTLLLRPWWRFPVEPSLDDNPGITDMVGNGEIVVIHMHKGHVMSVQARHSFRTITGRGGAVQADWSLPINDKIKLHLQVFHGHGESLLDYNHEQTMVSMGISLLEWL